LIKKPTISISKPESEEQEKLDNEAKNLKLQNN
jgi:hypothetical protein